MSPAFFHLVSDGCVFWAPGWHFDEFQYSYVHVVYASVCVLEEMFVQWFFLDGFIYVFEMAYKAIFKPWEGLSYVM